MTDQHLARRRFLHSGSIFSLGLGLSKVMRLSPLSSAIPLAGLSLQDAVAREAVTGKGPTPLHSWDRDPRNPIFVPKSPFDARGSQGPCVIPHDGQWWMFYGGHGTDDKLRICLATAHPEKPTDWERLGPVIDLGGPGAFDEVHCIYPCVHRFGNQWFCYVQRERASRLIRRLRCP